MEHSKEKSSRYEWKMVLILALLWGVVGLDRLVIVYLFPVLIPEYHLNNAQAGMLTSALALTWAISAWVLGNVSDRFGRKKVLIPSTIFFSLMSWMTGAAKSFAGLLAARALMGVGEGGVFSTSAATIAEVSTPSRKGFNQGFFQSLFPLMGIGLGAIITTQLNQVFSWQAVFFIVGIPGLILAAVLAFTMKGSISSHLKAKGAAASEVTSEPASPKPGMFAALKYRNVKLSSVISCLFMTWLFVFAAFSSLFLTEVRELSLPTVGLIISGWGFGGFVGQILIPTLSDYWGRRPVIILSTIINGLAVLWFAIAGDNVALLFSLLFVSGIFGFGINPIYLALCTTESVPPKLAASSIGIPTAIGEIFGAVAMPVIAGGLADKYGLSYPMLLAGIAPLVLGVVALFYIETAPSVLARKGEDMKRDEVIL